MTLLISVYPADFIGIKEQWKPIFYVFYICISQIKTQIDVPRVLLRAYKATIGIYNMTAALIKDTKEGPRILNLLSSSFIGSKMDKKFFIGQGNCLIEIPLRIEV